MSFIPHAAQGKSLKILITADTVGGVWTYASQLASSLTDLGVEVMIAAMGPNDAIPTDVDGRVQVVRRRCMLEWMDDPWDEIEETGHWLMQCAKEFGANLVHLNEFAHAALPWTVPVLVTAHSCVLTWWQAVKRGAAPAKYGRYAQYVRRALSERKVVTATHAFRRALSEEHRISLEGTTIANARAILLPLRIGKGCMVVSAGRLWDEGKNIQVLERIASRLKWPLLLAGPVRGPESFPKGPRACCLGSLDQRGMAELLASAPIYCAPARYEPFGLGILEAALAGCALILSDLHTLRENWDGAAEFVHPDDEDAWADAIDRLISEPLKRAERQRQARERALRFSPRRQATEYLRLYHELCPMPCIA